MEKSNNCFETNPDAWRAANGYGLQLLPLCKLEHYLEKVPNEKDLQDELRKAVTHPGKYFNLLVGQLDDEDLRLEIDEENLYDCEPWDRVTKNFFLAYHKVKAQARWFASRPDEAEQYKRFQVRTCVLFLYAQTDCKLTVLVLQLWYSQQAADGNASGHLLGFDGYRQFGPIKVVGVGGGGDDLPNIDVIAVGNNAATECLDDDSPSCCSG
jgi:hypothetical protein